MANQAQVDRSDAIDGCPRRKRLLADSKPKESSATASPESTLSSDSSSDRFAKKTRELPNLSDCHSCGVRINYTNPRERLQPLDSMWRVVLLCRKCIKRVKSSELCPYCFSGVGEGNDCFKCRDCQHSIHKDCVVKYSSGLGFSVCVDCWVPEAVVNSIRVKKRKIRKKYKKDSCEQVATLPESRVSVCETDGRNLEGEEVERKVAVAAKASENALRKAVAAKNAVEIAKGVLKVVASKKARDGSEMKVVDDAQLAFMLHRAINSSPRISRYASLTNSSSVGDAPIICYSRRRAKKSGLMISNSLHVPLMCYSRRRRKGFLMSSTPLDAPLVCYSRRISVSKVWWSVRECADSKLSERTDRSVSNSSSGLKVSNCFSLNIGTMGDAASLNGNECQEDDGGSSNLKSSRYLLKYNRIGKGVPRRLVFVTSDCGSYMDAGTLNAEAMSDTETVGNGNGCVAIGEKIHNENPDRFLLKYQRRAVRAKPVLSCKIEDYAPPSPLNCSEESWMFDARFQSYLQGSAGASGSSQEQL